MSQRASPSTSFRSRFSVRRDGVGELELVVQEPLVRLDVARLVHHLGGGVELGVDARHLLHDLGGADERALLAVQELRELPRLHVAADVRLLLAGHAVPDVGAEDVHRLVGQTLRVLGVQVLRPVDAGVGVPLERLALLVEAQEWLPRVLVLPAEDGVEGAADRPRVVACGAGIAVDRAHRGALLSADS
jgi:hypothetical protein